ncbi:MAG: hypothetical protein M1833_000818 [Piccolia ochrophora]|nr:MAG: hypothetical protein M1833_000818 [Piccolia ochrophora]
MPSIRFTVVALLAAWASTTGAQQSSEDLETVLGDAKNLTQFTSLVTNNTELFDALSSASDITIFAPSDEAFDKIPYSSLRSVFEDNDEDTIAAILNYHVVNGARPSSSINTSFAFLPTRLDDPEYSNVTNGQTVSIVKQSEEDLILVSGLGSRSSVTDGDISFKGGIIHVIDSFLIPPQSFLDTATQFNLTAAGGAAAKAEVLDYLTDTPDLTIFAPANDAFMKIGTALEDMTVADLAAVLSYHVVNGSVRYSSSLTNGSVLPTLNGANLTVRAAGNAIYINSARIVTQDLLLANGVLHIIDNVLNPNATLVLPNPTVPTQPAIIPGSAVTFIPFSADLPTSTADDGIGPTDSALASATDDASAEATSTDYSDASETSTGAAAEALLGRAKMGGVVKAVTAVVLGVVLGGALL